MTGSGRELVVAHSSDVHVDHHYTPRFFNGDGCGFLRAVVEGASACNADLLLLAGDTFDCHRLPDGLIEDAARVISSAEMNVVLLPGNHDPVTDDAVYQHPALRAVNNLRVLGASCGEDIILDEFDLQIWGRAHRDYLDMEPLAAPPPRAARWRIGMAHGHYMPQPDRSISPRPAWLFGDSDIEKAACDYIALGHWNRRVQAGPAHQQAHYCGSPDYACSFNLVEMSATAHITIRQIPLALSGDVLMKLQQTRP